MHIVLFEPQIPPNTGNVARTCAATGTVLHLVQPLGFHIDDRSLRRAGVDYWHLVDVRLHEDLHEVIDEAQQSGAQMYFFTKFAKRSYTEVSYHGEDYLVFGKETTGLPPFIHEQYASSCLRLPMGQAMRSLNLSNTVAIALYEALRQLDFPGLS
ncbi:tRNA (uridine(34)/cytosine(34)/5-carboxymethylaminomethyluridine(34)-2'-O)-methyltransferase TrmL [Sulfoacidibacillus thermotolerans]|uniref:Putative tRNA (cytidine(34)-2'-O)-methyltransferase n=1 Tax=Sulfoacidibacillus thermotolerans TaxID=1765684 RepID=A0A2U3DA05_SULT2|nr:tRNA (uridine(34)/cytosine(34)/5-carboxymethylaminomethyluridine(34)-2'-O)-methyltransferase TrmL [Sulfoacidibacillus thermotolerans]